ncbi:MAG: hypothetical protein IPG89_13655 [Bacteroidetes bacterium]|nr:hypothetical protein [Bacteroidota bacterium]
MRSFLLIFFAIAFNCLLVGQNKAKIDSLKQLGRDSLIKLAVKKINDKNFDSKYYDHIIVKADSTKLIVEFKVSIKLKTKGLCYYDAVSISLVGSGAYKSITGDCDEPKYYKPSAKQLKKIDFVFNSINKKNEIGDIPNKKLDDGTVMEITEMLTFYHIEMSDGNTMSRYKIDKNSGRIFDAIHKHYMKDRDDPPQIEIIEK